MAFSSTGNGIRFNYSLGKTNTAKYSNILDETKFVSALSAAEKAQAKGADATDQFYASHKKAKNGFAEYVNEVDSSSATFDGYVQYVNNANAAQAKMTKGQKLLSAGTKVASGLLNVGVGMAAGFAISAVVSAVDEWIHRSETIIQKGQEAKANIEELNSEYDSHKQTVDSVTDAYASWQGKVDFGSNKNITLDDTEYQSYLDAMNELASIYPSLVSGYDAQGNAILDLGVNADIATEKLNKLAEAERDNTNYQIAQQAQDQYKGIAEEVRLLDEEREALQKSADAKKEIAQQLDSSDIQEQLASGYYEIDASQKGASEAAQALRQALVDNGVDFTAPLVGNGEIDEFGIEGSKFAFSLFDIDAKTAAQVSKQFKNDADSLAFDLGEQANASLRNIEFNKNEVASKWNELLPTTSALMKTSSAYNEMDAGLQEGLLGMLSNVDYSVVQSKYNGDIEDFVRNGLIAPIATANEDVKDAYKGLFSLEDKRDELSVNEWAKQRDEYIETITGGDKAQTKELMQNLGYLDEDGAGKIKQQLNQMESMVEGSNNVREALKELSGEDFDIAYDILINDDDNAIQTLEQLKLAITEAKAVADSSDFSLSGMTTALEDAITNQASINAAIQNATSSTGLSADDVTGLAAAFADVEGYNTPELLERTASGVRINRDALSAYQAEQEKITKTNFVKAIQQQNEALLEQQAILTDSGSTDTERDLAAFEVSSIKSQIEQLKLLQSQYNGLTSDYAKWMSALENGEEGSVYDSVGANWQNATELAKEGWIGTDEFKRAVDYMYAGSLDNQSAKEVESVYETLSPLVSKWYQTNEDGSLNAVASLEAFRKSASSIGDVLGEESTVTKIDSDTQTATLSAKEFADAWGVSEEVITDIAGKMRDQGWEVDVTGITSSFQQVAKSAEEAEQKVKRITGDTYDYDYTTRDSGKADEQKVHAGEQLAQFRDDSGSYDYDKNGAKELAQVYEATVRAQKELQEATISSIDSSSVADSAKSSVAAAQSFMDAKKELDIQTELSSQGLKNNLEDATKNAENAYKAFKDIDDNPLAVDDSDLQTLDDSLRSLTGEEFQSYLGVDSSELDSAKDELDSLGDTETEVPVTVQFEEGQFSALMEGLTGQEYEVPVDANLSISDSSDLDIPEQEVPVKPKVTEFSNPYGNLANQSVEIPVTVETPDIPKVDGGKVTYDSEVTPPLAPNVEGGTVHYNADAEEPPIEDKQATAKFDADTSAPDGYQPPTKTGTVNYVLGTTPVYNPPNLSRTVTYNVTTVGGVGGFNGTAHALGTIPKLSSRAYAMGSIEEDARHQTALAFGNWKTKKSEAALIGELGAELVVTGNRWNLMGANGAEFSNIPAGSVVFNHKQTEAILKNGYISSRGKMVGGSSHLNGTAYADGTEDPFDWIEVKVERLTDQIERYIARAENRESLTSKLSNYQSALTTTGKALIANQKGYDKYIAQANSVNLDAATKELVRNGTIDIRQYSEDTQKLIDDYKKWYDAAEKCKDTIEELKQQQKELAKQKLDTIWDYYDVRSETSGAIIDARSALLDYRAQAGYSNTSDTQLGIYEEQLYHQQWNLTHLQRGLAAYQKEFEKQMKDGTITKYSQAWYDARTQIAEFQDAIYESKTALSEFEEAIRTINFEKLQYAVDKYDRWAKTLDGILDLKEARGSDLTESDYNRQLKSNNLQIEALYNQREEFEKEQDRYAVNSEKYQELADSIQDCDSAILSLLKDNEEVKQSINDARWQSFEEAQETVEFMVSELDNMMDLLNDDGFVDSETGLITSQGLANIGLAAKGMELYTQRIADYRTALAKLQENLDNGNISQSEYTEKSREYIEVIQDSVNSVQDYNDAIVDLYITQQEKQNELLQDEISLRQDALKKKRSYYEYDRKISAKSKDVNALQAQIQALSGVSSAYAKAELARLRDQLEEAQLDLDDTKKDHEFDLRSDAYDEMSDNADKALDKLTESVRSNMDVQKQVIHDMLQTVKTEYTDIFAEISKVISDTGLVTTQSLADAIASLSTATGASGTVDSALENANNVSGSDTTQNIKTDTIVTGNDITSEAEQEASKYENTTNRKLVSLTLNKTSVSVQAGKTVKVSVKDFKPSDATKTLKWKTSNAKIATVSGGTVKGVKAGSATITCYDTNSGVSATCSVKVTAAAKTTTTSKTTSASTTNAKVTSDNGLNLRSSTDATQNNIITTMPKGSKVQILGSGKAPNGELWYKLKYGTKTGWSNAKYIQKYASGTNSITSEHPAMIDEEGREMLVTKNGIITTVKPSDHRVITHKLSENIFEWGKLNPSTVLSGIAAQQMQGVVANTTEYHVDSWMTVNADTITRSAIPYLEEICEATYKYTTDKLKKESNKLR